MHPRPFLPHAFIAPSSESQPYPPTRPPAPEPLLFKHGHSFLHHTPPHTPHIFCKLHRLQPLPRILSRIVQLSAYIFDRLLLMFLKVTYPQIQHLEHLFRSLVSDDLGPSNYMPTRPGRVYLADPFDFAVVVVAFRGEVLPHEEVGGAVIDRFAESGEGL